VLGRRLQPLDEHDLLGERTRAPGKLRLAHVDQHRAALARAASQAAADQPAFFVV
jgi:hypothetical protein